MFQSKE